MDSTDGASKSTANCGTGTWEESLPESEEQPQQTESSANVEESKKRANPSKAWNHFVKTNVKDKAKCCHCSAMITCRTKDGPTTSAMLGHIKTCKLIILEEDEDENEGKKLKQSTLFHRKCTDGVLGSKVPSFMPFSQPATRKGLVEMIIMDELPFRFVEHRGFIRFMSIAQPRFAIPCRQTVAKDCLELYEDERSKLRKFFRNYNGSISLTTDCWTSIQNMSYMCLTAHYVDENWKLHKRIINFCIVDNHAGETIGKMVEKCLVFWGIRRVFTITVDNASSNDLAIRLFL